MAIEKIAVPLSEIRTVARAALASLGLSDDHQDIVLDVLLYAELRNKSQGLVKIIEKTVVPAKNAQPMLIRGEGRAVMHIKSRGDVGMVVLMRAAELAKAAAANYGIAAVGTSHTSTSTGSIGFYARDIAQSGMIGVVMAGSPKVMAVAQGVDPVMGTNPIAIAVPADPDPVVLDMASAAVTWFELINAARHGESIDSTLAFDDQGQPTANANAAMQGALKAFGGLKGSGLGLMIELLTGPLMGAAIVGDEDDNRGNFVMALDPAALGDAAQFRERTQLMLTRIRDGRRRIQEVPITFPGQHGAGVAATQLARGRLFIAKDVWQALERMGDAH